MARIRTIVALLGALVLLAVTAVAAGAIPAAARRGTTAITVDTTKVSTARLVRDLEIIAANEKLEEALAKDDIELVPRKGTISPQVSAEWVNTLVNQAVVDREFARRGLTVSAKARRAAKKHAAGLFRGWAVFERFPRSFRRVVERRQERLDVLEADFPERNEPTEADLQVLLAQAQATCSGDKLIAQIIVEKRAEADTLVGELTGGADFGTLARERSLDPVSAPGGGVFACVGSPRYVGSSAAVRAAAENLVIGSTSAPVKIDGGYAILEAVPSTFDFARPLLEASWRAEHISAFHDFIADALLHGTVEVAPRFATVRDNGAAVGILPPAKPVKL